MQPEPIAPQPEKETCASCGAKLKGDYCRKCGEKKIIPERDFSMIKFLKQTLGHFAHFDSKLLRSCWLLFSNPGFLTAEWTAGRRVNYMKPLQLFVVASVLFYFILPTTTAHFAGPKDLVRGYQDQNFVANTFQYDFEKTLTEKARSLQVDESVLESSLVTKAAEQSKTWLFLLIPLWGTLIYLFFKQKMPWLAPHLIFAMHGLTFYILLDLAFHGILNVLGFQNIGKTIFLLLMLGFPIYQALAARSVYGYSWPVTILKTMGIAAGFIALMLLYRQIMTIAAIAF